MAAVLIATQPSPWQRRVRRAGRVSGKGLLLAVHLALAVIVLAVRIPYTFIGIAARTAATAELSLCARTGRPPLGQTAGVALAAAFATEFRAGYHQTPRTH